MQAEIITLSLHVDYWNRLGWRDEFSSPLFSQRQTVYAQKIKLDSTYTPQMIVDGRIQFVGSNLGDASKAILEAAKTPKAKIETVLDGDVLKIKISDAPKHEDASVYLAVAENNLASNVKRGENAGKNLAHTSVVRELRPIGKLEAKSDVFEQQIAVARKSAMEIGKFKLRCFRSGKREPKDYRNGENFRGRVKTKIFRRN
jgi:hypothetical protein